MTGTSQEAVCTCARVSAGVNLLLLSLQRDAAAPRSPTSGVRLPASEAGLPGPSTFLPPAAVPPCTPLRETLLLQGPVEGRHECATAVLTTGTPHPPLEPRPDLRLDLRWSYCFLSPKTPGEETLRSRLTPARTSAHLPILTAHTCTHRLPNTLGYTSAQGYA